MKLTNIEMDDVVEILKDIGAIITDNHFVFTSGKHGDVYIRKDKLYVNTEKVSFVCSKMALKASQDKIDVVVGPALGGIILSQWTAHHLSDITEKEVLSVFTEKDEYGKGQIFKRGYDMLVKEKNVLIVEDLTTTGGSVLDVVKQVKEAGGNVQKVIVMVNRNPDEVNSEMMGAPFESLAVFKANAYDESECPLCEEGRPINTEVGHGREFLKGK